MTSGDNRDLRTPFQCRDIIHILTEGGNQFITHADGAGTDNREISDIGMRLTVEPVKQAAWVGGRQVNQSPPGVFQKSHLSAAEKVLHQIERERRIAGIKCLNRTLSAKVRG